MQLVSAEQMQRIDLNAIEELGIPGPVLMENAGRAAAEEIHADALEIYPGPVLIVAGSGNNGGDGYVIARILADRGWLVEVLILAPEEKVKGDARLMLDIQRQLGTEPRFVASVEALQSEFERVSPLLIVDALLGTGLTKDVESLYAAAIELINRDPAQVVAVDIPSGVNASDARIMGTAVEADLTLCFDSAKVGHASRPGAMQVGELRVLDIGIPRGLRPQTECDCTLLDAEEAASLLPSRPGTGHKGTFGHLGVVAGSKGMTGAAALSSEAGLRSGAGLVTLACPSVIHDILEAKLTEVMTYPLGGGRDCLLTMNVAELNEITQDWQALVIGPGLGQNPQTIEAVRGLLSDCGCPMVVDADALNALAVDPEILREPMPAPRILTPHPGEFSRLCGRSIAEIEADRFRLARDFATEYGVCLLLKGARTLIVDPQGRVRVNSSGNAGLASAGSGDVLSGLIGGLLVQGLSPFDAASLGAWLHGAAADLLADEVGCSGILAGDLLKSLPLARNQLEGAC